jgi:dihydrofolate reductase (trimethoprim resistance protein)
MQRLAAAQAAASTASIKALMVSVHTTEWHHPAVHPGGRAPQLIRISLRSFSQSFTERSGMDQSTGEASLSASGQFALPLRATFALGDRVRKKSGAAWQGRVVGWYSTELTPEGYAVESEFHPGSVQIYPVAALERVA